MTEYLPSLFQMYQNNVFHPRSTSLAHLALEKAINGKVNRENFEGEEVLGIRSVHERALSETDRGKQLVWNEPAVWLFQHRKATGNLNTFGHLGEHNNRFTVEEAATRVFVPYSCKVWVTAQIQIDSILYNGKDQTSMMSATSLTNLSGGWGETEHPMLRLEFKLYADTTGIGTGSYAGSVLDTRTVETRLFVNTAIVPSDDLNELRRGMTVNLVGVHAINVPESLFSQEDKTRIGKAVDYYVVVEGTFHEGEKNIDDEEVAFATVRSLARHITVTTYNVAGRSGATTTMLGE